MDTIEGDLGLSIIEQIQDKSEQVDLSPKALNQWLKDLPMADVSATSREVFYALHESHYVKMDPIRRFEICELFLPIIDHITFSLKHLYIGQNSANPNKKNKIAKLSETLLTELCFGYKSVIEALAKDKEKNKELLLLCMYRAIKNFNDILLINYQMYHPAPKTVWKEMNLLYAFCEKNNYHNQIVTQIGGKANLSTDITLKNIYCNAIILAITNPYRLRQSEISALYDVCGRWAPFIELKESVDEKASSANQMYVIETDKDSPPTYSNIHKQLNTPNIRRICLDKIVEHLSFNVDKLKVIPDNNMNETLSPELKLPKLLVQMLINSWSKIPDRLDTRTPTSGSILITLGIACTHYHISESQESAQGIESNRVPGMESNIAGSSVFESRDKASQDPWKAAEKKTKEQLAKEGPLELHLGKNNQHSIYKTHNCDLIDKSENGFCLRWKDGATPQLQAGEVIGALIGKDEFGADLWVVGSIQWLKKIDNNIVTLGILIFAPSVQAVGSQILKDNEPVGEHLRTLLLPEIPEEKIAATLITPTIPFKEGAGVEILSIHEEIMVTLDKRIAHTGSFSRFTLKFNEEVIKQTELRKKSTDIFDSLWTNLQN